jgi:NTE family protein
MPTAFVLSGGGSLGAVQVGMLQALIERGVTPDLVVGSSVGAVNGAWLALHPDRTGVDALTALWGNIRRGDVFPMRPTTALAALTGRARNLVPPHALERLLRRNLGERRIESTTVPLHLVATEVTTGRAVLLSSGDLVDGVLASSAIPGVFPPVCIGGHQLMDGGVVDNAPISHAVRLGADVVYLLPTGYACALQHAPRHALAMVLHAVSLLIEQQLMRDIERYEGACALHVLPPLCPLDVQPGDFSRSVELVERGRRETAAWLERGAQPNGQAELLAFHHHHHAPSH